MAPGMVKAMRLITGLSFSKKLISGCGPFCSESRNMNWLEGTRLEPALFGRSPDLSAGLFLLPAGRPLCGLYTARPSMTAAKARQIGVYARQRAF